jgi:DNA-binding response OmpR family regulator
MSDTPKRPRILIVEDDLASRSGLTTLLQRAGYETTAAGSFAEGLKALRDEAPDLLITDVRLGEFNGLQLVVMNARPTPAIVITAYDDPVLEAEARRVGADYLVKPVAGAHVLKLIEQGLATASDRAQTGPARRWVRKAVTAELNARVDDRPARIVDVSYGGLRFEIHRLSERALPPSFDVILPSPQISVKALLVWADRRAETWLCGAQISQVDTDAARAWHGLVDAVA